MLALGRKSNLIGKLKGGAYGFVLIGSGTFLLIGTILDTFFIQLNDEFLILFGKFILYLAVGFFLTCLLRTAFGGNVRCFIKSFFTETG